MVAVEGVLFAGKGQLGDYKWMAKQPEYDDALFIVTENVIDSMSASADDGGGTAAIRHLTWLHCKSGEAPRAAGIPTGFSVPCGGFTIMDDTVRAYIDLALERLVLILNTYPHLKRVIYSADKDDPMRLGSGIFNPDPSVTTYISEKLHSLAKHVPRSTRIHEEIRNCELDRLHIPILATENALLRQRLATSLRRGDADKKPGPSSDGEFRQMSLRSFVR